MDSLCEQETVTIWPSRGRARKAFEAVVNKHMKDAYFIALGLVGNREDALELSQEAFYRAYKNFDQLNSQEKFFPWFYQILRNLCFSHLRRRKVRRAERRNVNPAGAEHTEGSERHAIIGASAVAVKRKPLPHQ